MIKYLEYVFNHTFKTNAIIERASDDPYHFFVRFDLPEHYELANNHMISINSYFYSMGLAIEIVDYELTDNDEKLDKQDAGSYLEIKLKRNVRENPMVLTASGITSKATLNFIESEVKKSGHSMDNYYKEVARDIEDPNSKVVAMVTQLDELKEGNPNSMKANFIYGATPSGLICHINSIDPEEHYLVYWADGEHNFNAKHNDSVFNYPETFWMNLLANINDYCIYLAGFNKCNFELEVDFSNNILPEGNIVSMNGEKVTPVLRIADATNNFSAYFSGDNQLYDENSIPGIFVDLGKSIYNYLS